MAINKKQLVQVVLLVVLLAVGGGLYLMQQGDGFDLFALFSGKEPASVSPPTKAPPPPAPAARPAISQASGGGPQGIPLTPAKGQLDGKPFAPNSAVLESGVLYLRQGAGDIELRIALPGAAWETPAGRRFQVSGKPGENDPRVQLAWKEGEQWRLQSVTDKLALTLELGPETNRKLPGKLHLAYGEVDKNTVAGAFTAEVRGFRIVNGKPDLSADSIGTLEFLALRELLKDDPDKPVEVLAMRNGRIETASDKPTGYLEIEYRIGAAGKAEVQRYEFVKEADAWKVARVLGDTKPPPGAARRKPAKR